MLQNFPDLVVIGLVPARESIVFFFMVAH
jgi:hypothetical protein